MAAAMIALGGCRADPGYQGRASGEWIAQLGDSAVRRRADAAYALGQSLALQPDAPAVTRALIGALGDTSDAVRVAAARALVHAGPRASAAAAPGVAAQLADSAHADVRVQAARVLGELGPAGAGASVPALGRALRDSDPDVRRAAAEALGGLGSAARPVAPALAALVGDPQPDVRVRALAALARAAPGATSAAALAHALADPVPAVRAAAASSLGTFAADAGAAVPALIAALRDSSAAVRASAAVTLGLVDPARGRSALTAALGDPDALVRREAEHALSALHRRGGVDDPPPEPTRLERCQLGVGSPRDRC